MIIGVRKRGESRVRWIEVDDESLQAGDRVTVDGSEASVVVGPAQVRGEINPEFLTVANIVRVDPAEMEPRETQADELDRILATFPRPGSAWVSDSLSGTVDSINVKNRTISIKDSSTGETVVISHPDKGEQTGNGDVSGGSYTKNS